MTPRHSNDARVDRRIRDYLDWRAEDLGLAPTAAEMAIAMLRRRNGYSVLAGGGWRPVWMGLVVLVTVALLGVLAIGGGMLPTIDRPVPPTGSPVVASAAATAMPTSPRQPGEVPGNGWIAYPTRAHDAQSGVPGRSVIPGEIHLTRLGEASHRIAGGLAEVICPSFSPDGTRLAYVEGDDLVVLRGDPPDGLREEHRVHSIGRWPGACPVWSPSSASIAVLAAIDGVAAAEHIEVYGLTGTATRLPAPTPQDGSLLFANYNPMAWAPDGSSIAYAAADGLWVIRTDGSGPARLSTAVSRSVSWSADGSRLAYADAAGEVTVLSLQAPTALVLLGQGDDPAWAPFADEIAFSTQDGLAVVRGDGSSSRLLNPSGYGFGGWSPAGDYLLTMIDVSGHSYDLIAVSTTGGDNVPIATSIETANSRNFPDMGDVSWQPLYP